MNGWKLYLLILFPVGMTVSCNNKPFNYSDWVIKPGTLGEIKTGMPLSEARKALKDFSEETAKAYDYGYDGGGPAYNYFRDEELLFAVIPDYRDTVMAVVAINKNLFTMNGLHPGATAGQIAEKYPGIMVNHNLMMNWEEMADTLNKWSFIFKTDNDLRVGVYREIETPSVPENFHIQSNWIEIR